jgi:hypothetical protein
VTGGSDLSDYHVFLTAYGSHCPLYMDEQSPSGFVVSALDRTVPATSRKPVSGSFSWRVVVKGKAASPLRLCFSGDCRLASY